MRQGAILLKIFLSHPTRVGLVATTPLPSPKPVVQAAENFILRVAETPTDKAKFLNRLSNVGHSSFRIQVHICQTPYGELAVSSDGTSYIVSGAPMILCVI